MLHYGMQHAPHDGLNEPLSSTDVGGEPDYSQWLQLSSSTDALSSVQGHSQATSQAFVQDAYNAQESVYYAQATQAPATPLFDAQDQYTYYVYAQDRQHQSHHEQQHHGVQDQGRAEQQEQRHFTYLNDDHSVKEQMAADPSRVYSMYSQYSSQEPQLHMPIFSASSLERPPQTGTSQPHVLSATRTRGYQTSTNPLRPSRLRQVSNYEDDVADILDDHASTSQYDDHLAVATLAAQASGQFAHEQQIKQESLPHSFQSSVHPLEDTSPTISIPDIHPAVQSQSDSLYDALFSSADVAPIVTTHSEPPVENLWVADSDVVGSGAMDVDSLPAPTNFSNSFVGALSVESALAGAVMDEFDTPEPLATNVVGAVDGTPADTDADADGETETGSPLPLVMEVSTSNSSSIGNDLTLVDHDCFMSPQDSECQLVSSEVVATKIKVEHKVDTVPLAAGNEVSTEVSRSFATHESQDSSSAAIMLLAPSPPVPSTVLPPVLTSFKTEPSAQEAAAAANVLLTLAAPAHHQVTLVPVSSVLPIPLAATVASKRSNGGKRKRGSATSTPARSRVSSPLPLSVTKLPRRRFFPASPISFHIGPIDDVDPRTRLRHGTRGNKLVGIDAENQLDDKDREHDLFVIRGGIFDLVPNGSRIKVAAQRSGSRTKGMDNTGQGSASTSRAGSVAGSSPAPGGGRVNTRIKRGKGAAMPASVQDASTQEFVSPAFKMPVPSHDRVKREVPSTGPFDKPLFTSEPLELSGKRAGHISHDLSASTPTFSSATTHPIEPIAVPARNHASLDIGATIASLQLETTSSRRQSTKRQSAGKTPKAKKRKHLEDDDEDEFVGELESINHDGGYDDDYSARSTFRGGQSNEGPSSKRPRRHVLAQSAHTPPFSVPPRASVALPPIGTPPVLPGTPSGESLKSFPSPLTPLTDLHSSSPPAPLPVPSPSMQGQPAQLISRPHTPAPAQVTAHIQHSHLAHAPISPLSMDTTSPQVAINTERPIPLAKRAPRRAPAIPAFSSDETPRDVTGSSASGNPDTGGQQHADYTDVAAVQPVAASSAQPEFRTFPQGMEIRPDRFPLWYRRYPVVAVFRPWDQLGDAVLGSPSRPKIPAGATFNNPTTVYDLYTPRYVKGTGREKQGMCPVCAEAPERGGEGKTYWFAMKVSAYNYHMQNAHGISASSKLPFSPPVEFRTVARPTSGRHEKPSILEGKCHQCQKFIQLEGVKVGDIKVKEIYWWKHAAKCHQTTVLGECDLYYEDEVLSRVKAHEASERSAILRSAVRQSPAGTYTSYPMVPSNAPTSYVPTSPITPISNHGLPLSIHATQISYAHSPVSSIPQYHIPMNIEDQGSSLNPALSPVQPSYLMLHGTQHHGSIPLPSMQQMASASTSAPYTTVAHNLHASTVSAAAAVDAAAAYVAATTGFSAVSRPELHMQ